MLKIQCNILQKSTAQILNHTQVLAAEFIIMYLTTILLVWSLGGISDCYFKTNLLMTSEKRKRETTLKASQRRATRRKL